MENAEREWQGIDNITAATYNMRMGHDTKSV